LQLLLHHKLRLYRKSSTLFEIDGSQKSGSGTILRLSVALAAVTGQPLHICNIRQSRSQPGLKPQHREAVLTAARLCNAEVKGTSLGSRELWFKPHEIKGGKIEAEIGTAGSIPMLLMAVLPICAFAKQEVRLHVAKGGTDTKNAPTINYVRMALTSTLGRMGLDASVIVHKYGYYPKGMGEATLTVQPCRKLKPIRLERFGNLKTVKGISVCTFLADKRVAERQANAAKEVLYQNGYSVDMQVVNDTSNVMQKGSSIVLWAETDEGAVIGADAIGELGKPSEAVGREAAEKLGAEISAKPTVDAHLADMLIPYMAFAENSSVFLTRQVTEHLETNIWLVEKMLGTQFNVSKENGLWKVERRG
jgi:RNA 3'-terminal phosphate cyclase (ATP)